MESSLMVKRITPAIGAEIDGIDLKVPLNAATADELKSLLFRHKVLVFRDQNITPAQQVAFARNFGELEVIPFGPKHPDFPELLVFESGPQRRATENLFHTDNSYRERPPSACLLRCLELPEVGGDTIWVNMALAYEGLPAEVKLQIDGLHAVHDMMPNFGYRIPKDELQRAREDYPPMVHPLVVTHPITGEKVLYVNTGFATHISDYRNKYTTTNGAQYKTAAAHLLLLLQQQAQIPEYQMRLRWARDTVVLWDNIGTQHYAISDYYPEVRKVARVTISGGALS